jgi:hypothetical protein
MNFSSIAADCSGWVALGHNDGMPLSRELKQSILRNPFWFHLRMHNRVDRAAYQRLLADVRRLVVETRDDRELDKEVLQAIWTDIRVAEGTAERLRRGGWPEDEAFEVENMAIELDGVLIELLAVDPSSEDWRWVLGQNGPPSLASDPPATGGADPES